ncbi:MAG: T9SS type A sorting domain-containing protein, partial [Ferruginibacter sp.]
DDVKFGSNNAPIAPTVVGTVSYCQNTTAVPLSATALAGNTLLWYTVASGGIASFTVPTPSTSVTGTFNYYVSQMNAVGAEGPRSQIVVTVISTPIAPVANTLVTYCQNLIAAPLTATALTGNTLKWYTVAVGGISSTTAPTPSTTTAGTTPYYVSQVNPGGCEGPRTNINVVVNLGAGLPTVVSPINYCQNTSAVPLTATAAAGNTLKWYTVPVAGFGSATAPTPSTVNAGTVTYYVSQVTALGCEGLRAPLAVVVNATPSLPSTSTVTYCQNSTGVPLTATAVVGNTLKWYTVAVGGTGSAIAPTPVTTTTGTTTYYVSQVTVGGCESNRAAINVVVNPSPVALVVTTPVLYCQNETAKILNATAITGNSLNWYTTAVGGASSTIAPTPITSVAGTSTFYVSQSNSFACESPRAAIAVTVNPLPAIPSIVAAPYTKLNPGMTTTISTTSSLGNTYSWYRNGLTLSGQTNNAVNVTVDGIGSYQLKVTNANGCVNSSNTVIVSADGSEKLFVYPNPSNGVFQVRFFSDINDLKPRWLAIYDSKGAQVFKGKYVMFDAYTAIMVNLSTKSAGIYTIYLMDNNGNKLKSAQILIR